jgi:hypothetical protein
MAAELKAVADIASQLRTSWFGSVAEIADIDLQRRTWLDKANRNPHWSYVEFVSSFPDDDQLEHARREGWLSKQEFEILSDLRRALVSHAAPGGDDYDHVAVLDDPAWRAVVATAERAKQQLLPIAHSRIEREVLLGSNNAAV